jgi:thymidylate synthase (FAD)
MNEWMGNTHTVLDYGFVRLVDSMANDLSVVNSARVSFGKSTTEMSPADVGLINFLMRERHGTPFEHNSFMFHVKCPIFVAREWFRHRMGSFNEYSGRYSEMNNEFYVPDWDDMRSQVGKPGSYTFEPIDDEAKCAHIDSVMNNAYESAWNTYRDLIEAGLAKELARAVIPVGGYTEFYWTVNARSLMNFLSLRLDGNAQLEIRKFAEAVETFLEIKMPITHQAWKINERVAP